MMEENYITFEDYNLFYRFLKKDKNPDSPVLIFLHDAWGCSEMWGDFPEKMADLFRLNALIYDRRGYGKSSPFAGKERTKTYLHEAANELIRVMDKLKIESAILYGHSDGASTALIAAGSHPERFQAIMVEGPHSFMEKEGRNTVRESRDRAKHNSLIPTLQKFHGEKAQELFRRWHTAWLSKEFDDWSLVPLLKNITCPVLAFRGENDPYDTLEQLNVLEREIKALLFTKIIPDAAHTPRKENKEETIKFVSNFSKKIKSGFDSSK